jgi:hypothetical protein
LSQQPTVRLLASSSLLCFPTTTTTMTSLAQAPTVATIKAPLEPTSPQSLCAPYSSLFPHSLAFCSGIQPATDITRSAGNDITAIPQGAPAYCRHRAHRTAGTRRITRQRRGGIHAETIGAHRANQDWPTGMHSLQVLMVC